MYRIGVSIQLQTMMSRLPSVTIYFYNTCIKFRVIKWRLKWYYLNKESYHYCFIETDIEECGPFLGLTI